MNKSKINYWVDVVLAISFLLCFITGLLKWPGAYKLIGSAVYRNISLIKISRLHDLSGLIMGFLVLLHLILHWGWIVSMTRGLIRKSE